MLLYPRVTVVPSECSINVLCKRDNIKTNMVHLPLISIVTPSFNQSAFLERTITSVLEQNYPRLEYIVIDGNSTDESVNIIRKYAHRLAYWCSEPDKGQTDGIRKGMAAARGNILAYLNSDDVLRPGALASVAKHLPVNTPHWLIGNQQIIDEWDSVLCRRPVFPFSLGDIWYNNYLIPQECTFFNRKMLEESGGFDCSFHFAMDMHAWLRMASIRRPILLPDYIGCFRVHAAQKSSAIEKYFQEGERAKQSVALWRQSRGLSATPPKPLLTGWPHKAAKALFYLANGGPRLLVELMRFQRDYRVS